MFENIDDLEKAIEELSAKKITFDGQDIDDINDFPSYNGFPKIIRDHILECKDVFNDVYQTLKLGKFGFIMTKLTPRGNVKNYWTNYYRSWFFKVIRATNGGFKGVDISIFINKKVYKISIGKRGVVKNKELTGLKAYSAFLKSAKKHKIDLKKYRCDELTGLWYKQQIPKAMILKNNSLSNNYSTFDHVYHLDIHSAWPAGVINKYPEFRPVFDDLYKINKFYGPIAMGMFQSKRLHYCYSNLSYYGQSWCRDKIDSLIDKLIANDFEILLINTDGIWFRDSLNQGRVYHDEDEGTEIGQWKYDHKDCDFQAHSAGQYCFVEDGQFKVVCRGSYSIDAVKDRSEWTEEDYQKAVLEGAFICDWDDDYGILCNNELEVTNGRKR